jgi:hypothetical protein
MAENPIHEAAKGELERLRAILLESSVAPTFREFLQALKVVRMYEPAPLARLEPAPARVGAAATFEKSEYARVIAATAEFLRQRRERCTSSVITGALEQMGVAIGGQNKASRVSGYLSGAKTTFDNVRGEGYGLLEWKNGAAH